MSDGGGGGGDGDDDDFQNPIPHSLPLTQTTTLSNSSTKKQSSNRSRSSSQLPLKPSNSNLRPSKKPKRFPIPSLGKENTPPPQNYRVSGPTSSDWSNVCNTADGCELDEGCSLDLIPSSFDCSTNKVCDGVEEKGLKLNKESYLCNSIESRLVNSIADCNCNASDCSFTEGADEYFEPGTQLNVLFKLCLENEDPDNLDNLREMNDLSANCLVHCPLCGLDISNLSEELRQIHTNDCIDNEETPNIGVPTDDLGPEISEQVINGSPVQSPWEVLDISPVLGWLRSLGLEKYEEAFVQEEIDWDTLQWLTEEDLLRIGVSALGPRKKIVHAINELKRGAAHVAETHENLHTSNDLRKQITNRAEIETDASKVAPTKLITDYFQGSVTNRNRDCSSTKQQYVSGKNQSKASQKRSMKKYVANRKVGDAPLWCCVPGTPFQVDAFRFLRRDCSHWFLTHFHIDHYQGLTRSFCHGKIYCSLITARLVNLKIGIPWDRLEVLPLNQKICIGNIAVTCLDANHCPGSIMILFEPPNGKAVLHTGDFRFSQEMTSMSALQTHSIHTLILDTTYCNPQYDFPKQDAVIQFVIEAIQAEAFNPKTLFLIGSYTIGKERMFLEVARVLQKKIYVNASKLCLLKCLGFPEEDMQWFTVNEHESHIHVVPMWTLASFKRLKHISSQYLGQYNLIVAFSPTGWTFGKGKKKSPGRRWQQGTLIRYEVPYSEHSSFTELREFVKFIAPSNIIPSVNNDGPESANEMVALLSS